MGEACVGIVFYPNGNESSCSLNLRNGITQEDAKKLVPKFCSHVVFNNFSYGYSSTGGVVKADGNSDYLCWAHRILGKIVYHDKQLGPVMTAVQLKIKQTRRFYLRA